MEQDSEFESRLDFMIPTDHESCTLRWISLKSMYPNQSPKDMFDSLMKRIELHKTAAKDTHLHMGICDTNGLLYEMLRKLFDMSMVEWRRAEIAMITYQLECGMLKISGTDDDLYCAAETIFRIKLWLNDTITCMYMEEVKSSKRKNMSMRREVLNDQPSRMDSRKQHFKKVYEGLVYLHRWYESGLNELKGSKITSPEFYSDFYKKNTVMIWMLNKVITKNE